MAASESIAPSSSQLQQHHSEKPLQHNANLVGSSFVGQQSSYVQRLNVGTYLNVKQQILNNSPNVAPGWRRQLSDGEIIYYSTHIVEASPSAPQAVTTNSTSVIQPNVVVTHASSMFSVDNLVWGPVRGHTAWPGKIVPAPAGTPQSESTCWVRWFGGRPNAEIVQISSLKSLSEGLEAHHKAQKDNRKTRKLNGQLEKAIQEAMAELDRMPTTTTAASDVPQSNSLSVSSASPVKTTRTRVTRATAAQQKTKLIKIAPAPPNNTKKSHLM